MPVFDKPIGTNLLESISSGPILRKREIDFDNVSFDGSSFRFDAPGSALKSTQQIPLDWSKFENHTFFNSAEVNVNVAFDTIINEFPFDGTPNEIYQFLDKLTGFEKYVYDRIPKNIGSLHFDGTSFVQVNDVPGGFLQSLSKKVDGKPVLDPESKSISFQMKLFIPNQSNNNSVIFQRLSGSANGYSLFLSESSSSSADLVFIVSSGSAALELTQSIEKGKWSDVCVQFNRSFSNNRTSIFLDGNLKNQSDVASEFGSFNAKGSLLSLGSGSNHQTFLGDFVPQTKFSGSIDEFRVLHKIRNNEEIKNSILYSAIPDSDTKLLYRFNEPKGPYSQSSVLLDSSGNGLHSKVESYSESLRDNLNGFASFIERLNENPVLFPDYASLVSLNNSLILSASLYDENNPNLITKLVPKQYFEIGQQFQGLEEEFGTIGNSYPESGDLPRESEIGTSQLLASLLYIWAKHFDENKIFLDHFSKFETLSFTSTGSISNNFLNLQARNFGIELPSLFTMTDIKTNDFGDNYGVNVSEGIAKLQDIQYDIWRRIIASLPSVIRSKGTISSVKEIIRAFGINPDISVRIREYGGTTEGFIDGRRKRISNIGVVNDTELWRITSPFLSSSRIEPGNPIIAGTMTTEGSNNPSDGLLTSGSWSWEGIFKYSKIKTITKDQSLVRIFSTGSNGASLLCNVIANEPDENGLTTIHLYSAYQDSSFNGINLSIPNVPFYNGYLWNIGFGRKRINQSNSEWFFRIANQTNGEIDFSLEEKTIVTASAGNDVFSNISSTNNASGSYFILGNGPTISSIAPFLSTTNFSGSIVSDFDGQISSIRFYSKEIDSLEWLEHVRNPLSIGVKDPLTNFSFMPLTSGSWERIRIDANMNQPVKTTDSLGEIEIFDFSQNDFHLLGENFSTSSLVILNEHVVHSSLEPKFDERSEDQKVRIRSWQDSQNIEKYGGKLGPAYEVDRFEEGIDDNRFGIEISAIRALDEDIVNTFSQYQFLDNSLGQVSDMFEESYPMLDMFRETYFNRLTDKIEIQNVFLFSRWFEENIGRIIEQFIPANTRFFGTNFVIESHALERSKSRYFWGDAYLNQSERTGFFSIQDFTGSIST